MLECLDWKGERGGELYESNRIIILILCQIARAKKEMLHNMQQRNKSSKKEREANALCRADSARRKPKLQGCVSQRICAGFKCLPCSVPVHRRVLQPRFNALAPHAELNVVLISRNLCHNYFLIIPHCATGRHRTSLCVCNVSRNLINSPSSWAGSTTDCARDRAPQLLSLFQFDYTFHSRHCRWGQN